MRAMILAAGRGQRMRPLTDATPKPLLEAGGKPLIVWHIERLAAAGIRDIIINHAWLGDQIEALLGNGARWGVRIRYSPEPAGGLETAGGIVQALPFFNAQPFLVINGDVWCDWDPALARGIAQARPDPGLHAWLLLVDNPAQHPKGDFILHPNQTVGVPDGASRTLTFAGIGIYRPDLFSGLQPGVSAPLAPLLRHAMAAGKVTGSHHAGQWEDIGTPERLALLNQRLAG
ncbi:N-acetylmuramate alpha-1-phosphate uridylyltransferase MurU [Allopusillimonas ginsengisoli]|uniref:N-acetylmuramate alpha-1-phosphate uridylyltransferase MurU n=1 Tax=Allopusillimonas ginsengisoli TaxID=453575 RepID=UPI00101F9E89|nr:nucleotidyltransferase family protein [Allopusillimonas ginsengisoli]TEA80209.1 nucleotidyltransferase family protein [Allopusillimonas ginsengisoli]